MIYPIRDIYYRRKKGLEGKFPDYYSYDLENKIRNKIIGTIMDYNFTKLPNNLGRALGTQEYDELEELTITLEREFGKSISKNNYSHQKIKDFLLKCDEDEFLSTIEVLTSIKLNNIHKEERYETNSSQKMLKELNSFIDKINEIFRLEKIGYEIVPANLPKLPFIIVPFNSKYLHLETIKRPMTLMYDEDFKGPLNEFEDALDEYRNEIYKDTIHKANKAYESTLKTILDLKGVDYESNDNIPTLVEKIRTEAKIIDSKIKSSFDSFWALLKNGPPTIRNQPGIGHGQGIDVKEIEKSYADFVLRLTGTYIVFLIERYKETR